MCSQEVAEGFSWNFFQGICILDFFVKKISFCNFVHSWMARKLDNSLKITVIVQKSDFLKILQLILVEIGEVKGYILEFDFLYFK